MYLAVTILYIVQPYFISLFFLLQRMNFARVILCFFLPLVSCNNLIKSFTIQGEKKTHIHGVYMVEFSTSMKDNGKDVIQKHILSTFPGDNNGKHRVSFRTKTRTKLFHGHSFRVHGDFDEAHLLNIPAAVNVYRVGNNYDNDDVFV